MACCFRRAMSLSLIGVLGAALLQTHEEIRPIAIHFYRCPGAGLAQHGRKPALPRMRCICRTQSGKSRAQFLDAARSVEREKARLKRITAEFEKGFRRLGKLGLPLPFLAPHGSSRAIRTMNWPATSDGNWPWRDSPRSPAAARARWKPRIAALTRPAGHRMA